MRASAYVAIALALLVSIAACWAESDTAPQVISLAVNEIAEISLDGAVGDMAIDNPAVGGNAPATRSSDSSYVRYTSIVPAVGDPAVLQTRKIQAQITAGAVPDGTDLLLHAEPPTGAPAVGETGSRVGADEKSLGTQVLGVYQAQDLVSGIKCGWTGTDGGAGARLFYTFMVTDWTKIHKRARQNITVTFTLMDPA